MLAFQPPSQPPLRPSAVHGRQPPHKCGCVLRLCRIQQCSRLLRRPTSAQCILEACHLVACAALQNMMRTFRNRLGRLAKTAEDLRNMASPQWIPKVSAYINTCHYLEHHLRQSHLPLLLMHDSASLAPSPDRTRESTPVPPSPNPQPPAFTPNNLHLASPADGQQHVRRPTDPQIRANGGAGVGAYEAEAAAVGSFWKKWSLKLARAVVWQFEMDSRSYRYKSHLAEFSMTSYDREEG